MADDLPMLETPSTTEHPAEKPKPMVLELDKVSFRGRSENGIQLERADLQLREGELVTLQLESATSTRELASMLQGLLAPTGGKVTFCDEDWLGNDHDRHFRMRSRIGRVFEGQAWLENLNLDENVTLSCRHHGMSDESIREQVQDWVSRLGLEKLSQNRPAFTEPSVLQSHQWIRAFLGPPALVILERPLRFLTTQWTAKLIDAINELRSRGAAVLWFSSEPEPAAANLSPPSIRLQVRDNRLLPYDGGTQHE